MTTTRDNSSTRTDKMSIAEVFETLLGGNLTIRIVAYDGSTAGPADSKIGLNLKNPRGTTYLVTAPGDLGLARAYVSGDLEFIGAHPADPYHALRALAADLNFARPTPLELAQIARSLGIEHFKPIAPPPQEALPRWRRFAEGLRHSRSRDAEVIHHHYDVSNTFYEWVLGPSMTYTCAVYPNIDASLEAAQENKYRLIFDKLRLKPGDRLLDIGCGWGSMVRYAAKRGVFVIGATLSAEQAEWGQQAIIDDNLSDYAEIRHCDYRDVTETGFDAVSSIGLTEHIGVHNYPAYFKFIRSRLRVGGMLLNHCITRPDNNKQNRAGSFIDRYVFPDGELTGSGKIISKLQDIGGMEVIHEENFRDHYALTLRDWNKNLVDHWDEAVEEVGDGTARLWGLYMAGCRIGFERNIIQLHHVLATKLDDRGGNDLPLRPWWEA